MVQRKIITCLCMALVVCTQQTWAMSAEEELALAYGDMPIVTIATGSATPVHKAPATTTVITAEQIKALGANDLDQALEWVPGLHVSKANWAMRPLYGVRGVITTFNPQVLMLLNGTPINTGFLGDRSDIWGGLSVHNIERIEVIRGPGSALYGADAFTGVINVITKTAQDVNGLESGLRVGSFDSQDAWLQYGGQLGAIDTLFYLRYGHTDGSNGVIESDFQTLIDSFAGTKASLAPGPMNEYRKALDLNLDLSRGAWRFRNMAQQRDLGLGAGLAGALDPDAIVSESRWYSDLIYSQDDWLPQLNLEATLSYMRRNSQQAEPYFQLLPPGSNTAPFLTALGAAGLGGVFPNGMIGNPGHDEDGYHARASMVYRGWQQHQVRAGLGFRTQNLKAIQESKNFHLLLTPLASGLQDVSHDPSQVFMQPHKREMSYLFLQDEWNFAPDWMLTAGVRHDRYSDFGSTNNPRIALVWDAAYNWTIKAMYGQAFRAPSFTELYNLNNPVNIGNPQLQPERIASKELFVNWQAGPSLSTNLGLFTYQIQDSIRIDAKQGNVNENLSDVKGHGFEWAFDYKPQANFNLAGHFAWQRSAEKLTRQDAGLAPQKQLQLRANWIPLDKWNVAAVLNHVADRARQPGDPRKNTVADYTTLDLNLRRENLLPHFDVQLSAHNLFNANAKEPSYSDANMASDIPLDSRAVALQVEYKW